MGTLSGQVCSERTSALEMESCARAHTTFRTASKLMEGELSHMILLLVRQRLYACHRLSQACAANKSCPSVHDASLCEQIKSV
jgi:hypothetical protein